MKKLFLICSMIFAISSFSYAGDGVEVCVKRDNGKPYKGAKVAVLPWSTAPTDSERTGSDGCVHISVPSDGNLRAIYVNGDKYTYQKYSGGDQSRQGETYTITVN